MSDSLTIVKINMNQLSRARRPAARIVRGASHRAGSTTTGADRSPTPLPSLLDSPQRDDEYEPASARSRPGEGRVHAARGGSIATSNGNNVGASMRARRRLSTAMPLRIPQSSLDAPLAAVKQQRRRPQVGSEGASRSMGIGALADKAAVSVESSSLQTGAGDRVTNGSHIRARITLDRADPSRLSSTCTTASVSSRDMSVALQPISANTIGTRHVLTARGTHSVIKKTSSNMVHSIEATPPNDEQPDVVVDVTAVMPTRDMPSAADSWPINDSRPSSELDVLQSRVGLEQQSNSTQFNVDTQQKNDQSEAATLPATTFSSLSTLAPAAARSSTPVTSSDNERSSSTGGTSDNSSDEQDPAKHLVDLVASMTYNARVLKRENKELAEKLKVSEYS
jgi:hypothetical protein